MVRLQYRSRFLVQISALRLAAGAGASRRSRAAAPNYSLPGVLDPPVWDWRPRRRPRPPRQAGGLSSSARPLPASASSFRFRRPIVRLAGRRDWEGHQALRRRAIPDGAAHAGAFGGQDPFGLAQAPPWNLTSALLVTAFASYYVNLKNKEYQGYENAVFRGPGRRGSDPRAASL